MNRRWPDLSLSSTDTFASKTSMVSIMRSYLVGISGLAIILGGVGMMNAQLMSVIERTQEIGVLKALGWSSFRIMRMILVESVTVTLFGGVFGLGLGVLALIALSSISPILSDMVYQLRMEHILSAIFVVIPVGFIGGSYPAWRASRMLPVEAFRFAGGAANTKVNRLPVGGMAVQSLWQRTSRTILTLSAIGITVGSIMGIEGVVGSMADAMGQLGLAHDPTDEEKYIQSLFQFMFNFHFNPLDEEYILPDGRKIIKKGLPNPLFQAMMDELRKHFEREAKAYKKASMRKR